jgi:hypothetical protein
MADVFISYTHAERDLAREFADALAFEGFSVWYDQRIQGAEVWDEVIDREIRGAGVVVTLWTPASTASRWVRSEADFASERNKLLPVMAATCEPPIAFRLIQAVDLRANGKPLRERASWPSFTYRIREMGHATAARSATQRETEDAERTKRRRRNKLQSFIGRVVGIAVLAAALIAAAAWWQDQEARKLPVDVTPAGAAISLGGLRGERVAEARIGPASPPGADQRWTPVMSMVGGQALLVEMNGGVNLYRRSADSWALDRPLHFGDPCADAADATCRLTWLGGVVGRTDNTLVVGALDASGRLRVWAPDLVTPDPACPGATACGVTKAAVHASLAAIVYALDTGVVRRVQLTAFVGHEIESVVLAERPGLSVLSLSAGDGDSAAVWSDGAITIHAPTNYLDGGQAPAELIGASGGTCERPRAAISEDGRRLVRVCDRLVDFYARGRDGWSAAQQMDELIGPSAISDDDTLIAASWGPSAVLLPRSGEAMLLDAANRQSRELGQVRNARFVRLRARDAIITLFGDIAPNGFRIMDSAGSTLASARFASGWSSALDVDTSSIWMAFANPYDGRVSVWRVFDPAGPLIDIGR